VKEFGVRKLIGGVVFSVGLILVALASAELFTVNILLLSGVFAGKISVGKMLRNRFFVYIFIT